MYTSWAHSCCSLRARRCGEDRRRSVSALIDLLGHGGLFIAACVVAAVVGARRGGDDNLSSVSERIRLARAGVCLVTASVSRVAPAKLARQSGGLTSARRLADASSEVHSSRVVRCRGGLTSTRMPRLGVCHPVRNGVPPIGVAAASQYSSLAASGAEKLRSTARSATRQKGARATGRGGDLFLRGEDAVRRGGDTAACRGEAAFLAVRRRRKHALCRASLASSSSLRLTAAACNKHIKTRGESKAQIVSSSAKQKWR